MNTYRIMNKKNNQWWQGEADNAEEACKKATWPPFDCLIKWNPMNGNSGWMKCREEIKKGETMNKPVVRLMIYKEARECVDKIKANMNNVRELVLVLYEREGWTALGYPNWRECVMAEFKQGQAYLYRQLEAAQTERNISTIVENADKIPESQLQPLTKLRDNPDQQREAWQMAVDTAPEGKVTAAHVSKVVNELTGNIAEKKEKEIIKKSVKVDQIDPEFKTAWDLLFVAVKNLKALKWKRMSRDNALRQIQILMDIIEI